MNVLVIGGTGTVGSQVVKALRVRGATPVVLTRDPGKLLGVVDARAGDLQHPETLAGALEGIDAVFMATSVAPDETNQGLAAVEAAKAAKVRRFVYMSVQDIEGGMHIPHFASKIPIEYAVRHSGAEWSILRPNNFFQTDLGFRDAIVHGGVFPFPVSPKGLSRVDARDIGEAAAAALTTDIVLGRAINVAGPDVLTGPAIAAVYSAHLGKPIQYVGGDIEAWAAQMAGLMPAWLVLDLKIMLAYFDEKGLVASEADLATLTELLGRPPKSFSAFVAEAF